MRYSLLSDSNFVLPISLPESICRMTLSDSRHVCIHRDSREYVLGEELESLAKTWANARSRKVAAEKIHSRYMPRKLHLQILGIVHQSVWSIWKYLYCLLYLTNQCCKVVESGLDRQSSCMVVLLLHGRLLDPTVVRAISNYVQLWMCIRYNKARKGLGYNSYCPQSHYRQTFSSFVMGQL